MKKLISMLVVLAMLMTMAPAVFAADENALVLGSNTLTSGNTYTYVVPETTTGRLEFDSITVKNSSGSTIYWYTYSKGNNAVVSINGQPISSFYDQTVTVAAGDTVSVYVESVDGDTYTVTLTLSEIDPPQPLSLGLNNIAGETEYAYTAEQAGTLYVSVVEMIHDGATCDDSALNDYQVTMKINGAAVYSFENSYTVEAGDEVSVYVEPYWSGTVSAVVYLSYEGFYEHPAGSQMNPVYLYRADCPTKSIEIAAGSTAWYELESYYDDSSWSTVYAFSGYDLIVTGENAYVIVDGTRYDAVDGVVTVRMDSDTLIQIGNDGSAAATFDISYSIPAGHVDNPQDLAEGDNAKTLARNESYYFDFDAACNGTVTAVISGDNWRYDYWHLDADGSELAYDDLYYKNGESDTLTLEMTAGQRLVIMLSTSQGWSRPGGDLNINFTFAADHQFGDYISDGNATCTEDGTKTATCAVCGETDTIADEGSALGHSYESVTVDPTCTEDGSVTYTCTACGDSYAEVITATGHDYTAVVTAPTCTEQGYTTYTCACGDSYVDDYTDALGHSYEAVTTEPTCTADGSITYTCACGDSYAEVIEATGHTEGEAVSENEVPATCTEDGSYDMVVYCTDCGEELSRETMPIIASGHTAGEAVVENVVAATCTEDGSHDEVVCCSVCDAELSRTTVTDPATGHTAGEAVIENEVPATCTQGGSYDEVVYCTVCGDELSRETGTTPATGHTRGDVVIENEVPATCTQGGSHDEVVYCTVCDEELARETITDPATGHDYVDGECADCGEADPDYEAPTEAPTEEPTEEPTEAPTEAPTQKPADDSNVPSTGDPIMMSLATALLSGMSIIGLVSKKKEF